MKKKFLLALSLILFAIPLGGCGKETVSTNYYDDGKALVEERKFSEAISTFTKGLEAEPSNYLYYLEIATIYKDKGLLDKAIETADIGLSNVAGEKNLLLVKAEAYFTKADYENAAKYYLEAFDAGESSDAKIQAAVCKIKLKKFDESKTLLSEVDAEDSAFDKKANYYLSVLTTDNVSKSLEYINNAQDIEDEDLKNLVSTYKTLLEELKQKSEQASVNENFLKLLQGYALIKVDQFEIAETIIEPVARHYESEGKPSYQANFYLGSIYYHLGEYEKAKTELATSIMANSTDPITLHLLALTYSKLNDQVNSIDNFEKSIMLDSNNEKSRYDFIQALIKFKINSKADTNFKEIIALNTDKKPQYQLEYAEFLNDILNNAAEADKVAAYLINEWEEFGTSSNETKAEIYDTYGWSLYLQGKNAEALENLNRAKDLDGFSAKVYYHLAKVMEKDSDFETAKSYYLRAIDLSFDEDLSVKANQDYQNLIK